MTSTLQTIIAGWRQASKVALQALENSALSHVEDEEKFREDLMNIARTTISSKILSQHKDFFAKLAVDAVLRLKGSGNLDAIQIIKIQGGSLDESFLDSGSHILKDSNTQQYDEQADIIALQKVHHDHMDSDKFVFFLSDITISRFYLGQT